MFMSRDRLSHCRLHVLYENTADVFRYYCLHQIISEDVFVNAGETTDLHYRTPQMYSLRVL
jgi:hypothetical protein